MIESTFKDLDDNKIISKNKADTLFYIDSEGSVNFLGNIDFENLITHTAVFLHASYDLYSQMFDEVYEEYKNSDDLINPEVTKATFEEWINLITDTLNKVSTKAKMLDEMLNELDMKEGEIAVDIKGLVKQMLDKAGEKDDI